MKISVAQDPARGDVIAGLRSDQDPQRYSEWHHFNFSDEDRGVHGIVNLALSGDLREEEQGQAGVSIVVWSEGAWHGTMNLYSTDEARFDPGHVDLAIADSSVVLKDGRYHVWAALKDGAVVVDAMWQPRSAGMRIDNIGGVVSTFIVPSLAVDGSFVVAGREYRLREALGYHDHNWGYWRWGRDMGWDWGYVIQPPGQAADPRGLSLVFGQVTDATRAAARSDMVLMVWSGGRWAHVFLDDAVRMETEGVFESSVVPRVPGLLTLLQPERPVIPKRLRMEAREEDDWLAAVLDVEHALQFLIPHPGGSAVTTISELLGRYRVAGSLDGKPFEFEVVGFAELAG